MGTYEELEQQLRNSPRRWAVTGAAGFIGSHLVERLLSLDQCVSAIDNFSTGKSSNLDAVRKAVSPEQWRRFTFTEGDICDRNLVLQSLAGSEFVLHQAALGSVPRSVEDPFRSSRANVDGTLTVLVTANRERVERVVYASSSSVYGDNADPVKIEARTGEPLSPYAATKRSNELFAASFASSYGLSSVGLRYFNVFGSRQDPEGDYAAVIPRWLRQLVAGEQCVIYGDGETARDFCYIENVVRANLLAATTPHPQAHRVYNVAVSESTTLNSLYRSLTTELWKVDRRPGNPPPVQYAPFRTGDIRNSCADISRASEDLGYVPAVRAGAGFELVVRHFVKQ